MLFNKPVEYILLLNLTISSSKNSGLNVAQIVCFKNGLVCCGFTKNVDPFIAGLILV